MPTWTTGAPDAAAASAWACSEAFGEAVTALLVDGPSARGGDELVGARTGGQVAGEGEVAALDTDRPDAGLERVEQRRRRQVGGQLRPDDGAETGLGLTGHGRLGDDQHDRLRHERTRAKSRAVRRVPITEPDTLDFVPSARGW